MSDAGAVLTALKELLWKVYELEETVRFGGGPEQQDLLEQRLLALMQQVRETAQMTSRFEDLKVPVDLLKYVDAGGLPDQYTADTFKASLADNQASKGRVEAVARLRAGLLQQLEAQLPEQSRQYQELLEQQRQQAGQQAQEPA